jgi:hypothetical protein
VKCHVAGSQEDSRGRRGGFADEHHLDFHDNINGLLGPSVNEDREPISVAVE